MIPNLLDIIRMLERCAPLHHYLEFESGRNITNLIFIPKTSAYTTSTTSTTSTISASPGPL